MIKVLNIENTIHGLQVVTDENGSEVDYQY